MVSTSAHPSRTAEIAVQQAPRLGTDDVYMLSPEEIVMRRYLRLSTISSLDPFSEK